MTNSADPTNEPGETAHSSDSAGIRARGEEALSELAQAVVDNPVFSGALARALGAGERAASAQRQAIGALNLASGSDVERLEQRLRSFSARLEAIEDQLDDLARDVADLRREAAAQAGDAPSRDA
jgi:chromosome segregation ATPase